MLHNSCNTGTRGLPDTSTLGPAALGLQVYISGRPLMPVLQLLHMVLVLNSENNFIIPKLTIWVYCGIAIMHGRIVYVFTGAC